MRTPLLWFTASLVACNPDSGLTLHDNNRPPEVVIVTPGAGEQFLDGDDVTFTAQVTDDATTLADLDLSWRTSNGGAVEGAQTLSDDIVTIVATGLATGEHTVSLTAVDGQGADGHAEVAITIDANLPPTVTFLDPSPEGRYAFGASVPVAVSIDDDWDAPTTVTLSWGDAAATVSTPTAPDDAGEAQFTIAGLAIGAHRVTVTALDALGSTRTRSVDFEVVNPDGDGDGHDADDFGGDDCDDTIAATHPGAAEVCDGDDNDCNGTDDDDPTDGSTWFYDDDLDGYGDPGLETVACAAPGAKWKAAGGDCDDDDNARFPGNAEVCDGKDNDCAGGADNGLAFTTYYTDGDGDTWGLTGSGASACAPPANTATRGGDCSDGNSLVNPGRTETCNGVDDDCAGGADNGLSFTTYYPDGDGDTWGLTGSAVSTCAQPPDHATRGGDCNDGDNLVNPGRTETCNGIDDNCAGGVDNGLTFTTYYPDGDGDTWGLTGSAVSTCAQPPDHATRGGDCNDGDNLVNPGRTETCNGIDDNCAGGVDNGLTFTTYYPDTDADTWGTGSGSAACAQPQHTATRGGDCNDTNDDVHPTATETCNGIDDNCAGGVDNGLTFTTWYYDFDLDGYGDPGQTQSVCNVPTGRWVDAAGDCNDSDVNVNPLETEVCNGKDDDCAGGADDDDPGLDTSTASVWYFDDDGDTWGISGSTTLACDEPLDYADVPGDCNDNNANVNPDENEVCSNGIDDDCANGVDDACDLDYSGVWKLYIPGTNTVRNVAYACDGWSFSFNKVTIIDGYPQIEVVADETAGTNRVNGCEPGFEVLCPNNGNSGMTGAYDTATRWTASGAIEPLFGMGYAELYQWRATSGASGTFAEFTNDTTFVGTFSWRFEPRSSGVPAGCNAGFVTVEGRKQ